MVQIPLTSEQKSAIQEADGPIVLVDDRGCIVGEVAKSPFTEERVRAAEKRLKSPGPWRTTQEVLERLDRLQ